MSSTTLYCLGICHQTAPVALREAVQSSPAELEKALVDLEELPEAIYEWVVLSTCNRFEVYVQMSTRVQAAQVKYGLSMELGSLACLFSRS